MNAENGEPHAEGSPGMTPPRAPTVPFKGENSLVMMALQRQIDELKANYDSNLKRLRNYVNKRLKDFNDEKKTLREELDEIHKSIDFILDLIYLVSTHKSNITLKDKVLELEEIMNRDISITDLRDDFICSTCGNRRSIAINMKCTNCKTDVWRGWHSIS